MRARLVSIPLAVGALTLAPSATSLVPGVDSGGVARAAASPERLERLRERIAATEGRVARRKGRERVLTTDVQRFGDRIDRMAERIAGLQARQDGAQRDLDASTAELERTQLELRTQRRRLVRLRGRLAQSRRILAARLVELYQADKPDLVGVVVNSQGFSDLLERAEFLQRIGQQDRRVVGAVRSARSDAATSERRLARLEGTQRATARRIEGRRNEIATVRRRVMATRTAVAADRADRSALLRSVRGNRQTDEGSIASMRRAETRIRRQIAAASTPAVSGGGGDDGSPVKRGSGRLVWPANGQFTSPFGPRWGRLHAGIDIAVPTGTPVRAADAGTVTIAGWTGGYGNYVCVDVGGGLTVCGAHNSSLKVRVGQRVARGEVVALSGNTGNSTGPHVHFETRVGGVPRDPMNYL